MNKILVGLAIVAILAIFAFFIWLFWTVSGMIMQMGGWSEYGWPLQLVIFLLLWSLCGGISAKVKS